MQKIFKRIIIGLVAISTIFVFDFWLFSPKDFSPKKTTNQRLSNENTNNGIDKKKGLNTGMINLGKTKDSSAPGTVFPVSNKTDKEIGLNKEQGPVLPNKAEIKNVPFLVQSPFARWDNLHNEACEETALIMADYWVKDMKLDKKTGDKKILDSIAWQKENWGGHYDLPVRKIVELARNYFGMEKIYYTKVRDISDIKGELSKGNLVIVPTAGRLLNNPYYKRPGPVYHALVLKGYKGDKIIVNDPGTKKGEDYIYSQDVLMNAIHEWPLKLKQEIKLKKEDKAKEILNGDKMMVVVEKK